jgi:hypothetical protein
MGEACAQDDECDRLLLCDPVSSRCVEDAPLPAGVCQDPFQ